MTREDGAMDALDGRELTEDEWLAAWRDTLVAVEHLHATLTDPESGMDLTDAQAAHLAGEAAMLRRVLDSRGIYLSD